MQDGKTTGQHRYSSDSKKPRIREASLYLVGLVRFELTTPCMSSKCSNQLSYSPVECVVLYDVLFLNQYFSGNIFFSLFFNTIKTISFTFT